MKIRISIQSASLAAFLFLTSVVAPRETQAGFYNMGAMWSAQGTEQPWTWVSGVSATNQAGVYGTLNVPSAGNHPGSRQYAHSWIRGTNYYLFGGNGFDSAGSQGVLNDFWKFDMSQKTWTWIGGSNLVGSAGTPGTKGTGSTSNIPFARYQGNYWTDRNGKFWLHGGNNGTAATDVWNFDPGNGQWTWVNGSNPSVGGESAVYGPAGTYGASYKPGAVYSAGGIWVDSSNHFWLFGGDGYNASTNGLVADLWQFDPGTNQWAYMSGPKTTQGTGNYGTLGTPAGGNAPGSRSGCQTWTDSAGNFWLFGGEGYGAVSNVPGELSDLWKYSPSSGLWTWMAGPNSLSNSGVMGSPGVGAAGNNPGGRLSAASWTDLAGNFWLFGGQGRDANGNFAFLNDVWMYSPGSGYWTWMGGAATAGAAATYGTLGNASPGNTPGARSRTAFATDASGHFWLMGGQFESTTAMYDDLWEFRPRTVGPVVTVSNATADMGASVVFTITLNRTSAGPVTVHWATSNGSAIAGTDYTASSGTATVAAGTKTTTVSVPTLSSNTGYGTKTFTLTLSSPTGAVLPSGGATATGSVVDAILNFDFTSGLLPPGLTFARGSPATYFDSAGVLRTTSTNLMYRSEVLGSVDGWQYVGGVSVAHDSTQAPDGSMTADLLREDLNNNTHTVVSADTSFTAGSTLTCSVFAKAAGRSGVHIQVWDSNVGTHTFSAGFNVATGVATYNAAGSGGTFLSSSVTAFPNGWYRLQVTGKLRAADTPGACAMYLTPNPAVAGSLYYTGDGVSGVYFWGAQFEQGVTASPYAATTTVNADGLRFDYDPVSHVLNGALVESAATNRALYSEQVDNAAWTKLQATVSANTAETTDPTGANLADRINVDATTNYHYVKQTVNGAAAGSINTFSIFLKNGSPNGIRYVAVEQALPAGGSQVGVRVDLTNGATVLAPAASGLSSSPAGGAVSVGNGWYRVWIAGIVDSSSTSYNVNIVLANSATGSNNYAGDGVSGLYAYGAQVESGPVPTSYIPTVGSSVTRNADLLSVDSFSTWFNASAWTAVATYTRPWYEPASVTKYPRIFEFFQGATTYNDRASAIFSTAGSNIVDDWFSGGVLGGGAGTGASSFNTPGAQYEVATLKNGTSISLTVNGAAPITQTISAMPSVDTLMLGSVSYDVSSGLNGYLRKFTYRRRAATGTQLNSYTTE